jgi:oligopeptide transport system permease protein
MLEVIKSDWVRTARAKGVPDHRIVTRHALKGALLPTVSWLGPGIASIVSGSIVVERIYGIPGLSEHFVTPAINRDYPMVIGVIVVYSAILFVLNLIVDIAYTFLDPRVKVS